MAVLGVDAELLLQAYPTHPVPSHPIRVPTIETENDAPSLILRLSSDRTNTLEVCETFYKPHTSLCPSPPRSDYTLLEQAVQLLSNFILQLIANRL